MSACTPDKQWRADNVVGKQFTAGKDCLQTCVGVGVCALANALPSCRAQAPHCSSQRMHTDQWAAPQSCLRRTCCCFHAGTEPLITPVSRCLLVSGVHPDVPERKLRTYLKADFSILGERHAPRQLVFHTIQWVTELSVAGT